VLQLFSKNKLILIFTFLFMGQAFGQELATAIYVRGAVAYIHHEVEGLLQQGQKVEAGDEIITGKSDLVILSYVNNSKIKIDPDSHIIVEDLEPAESGQRLSLFVKLGSLMIQFFNPKKNHQLQVRTKNASLGVRGTKFLLGIDETDQNVHVSVDEGRVAMMSTEDDDHEIIAAGESLVMEEGRRLTKPYASQWIRKLNWSMNNDVSGFKNKEIRAQRRDEFLKRRPQLLNRRVQKIEPLLKARFRWTEVHGFKGLPKKEALKKFAKKGVIGKNIIDDQNKQRLKQRLKKRLKDRKEVPIVDEPIKLPEPIKPPPTTRPPESND